jgi:predicted methyltransferase MtxX (methanogen marker protein 4)
MARTLRAEDTREREVDAAVRGALKRRLFPAFRETFVLRNMAAFVLNEKADQPVFAALVGIVWREQHT